jgi:uncharacterized repeat protein (TIGR03803 family)
MSSFGTSDRTAVSLTGRILPIAAATALLSLAPLDMAAAFSHKIIHNFCSAANCADGAYPYGSVIADASGNLYGATSFGGKYGYGLVYKLVPNPTRTKWKEYALHSFCKLANCLDGTGDSPLIIDANGNLYGATYGGNKYGAGGLYELSPGANGWTFKVIHNFCRLNNCTDGSQPDAGLHYMGQESGAPWNETSPLFGTTTTGGKYASVDSDGNGVAFSLTPSGSQWTYAVIHQFQDSAFPNDVLVDSTGNVFGTASAGGANGGGLLYKLDQGTWHQTVLHQFCALANCTDGKGPFGGMAEDASGNLFGTTAVGGSAGKGVAFEYNSGGQYKAIYSFCSLTNCADGGVPEQSLLLSAGSLFGTTSAYGASGQSSAGTVFKLANSGANWSLSTLYSFCTQANCADGAEPVAGGLVMDGSGNLFGTTVSGGTGNAGNPGTVFELSP